MTVYIFSICHQVAEVLIIFLEISTLHVMVMGFKVACNMSICSFDCFTHHSGKGYGVKMLCDEIVPFQE